MKILIIEGKQELADAMKFHLESEGFETETVFDGISGQEYAQLEVYDLLLIDGILSGQSACQLIKNLRKEHCGTPILLLTAEDALEKRVEGLRSGADYCLAKPFDERELSACIQALLRRQGSQINELRYGHTSLELSSGLLTCCGHSVRLSAREFGVMRILLQNPKYHHSKEAILARIWGYESNATENHVEVYVGFLRKKLRSIGSDLSIVAVRKLGYHLEIVISNDGTDECR